MRVSLSILILLMTILFGVSITGYANQNSVITKNIDLEPFLPNELIFPDCVSKESMNKINQINSSLSQFGKVPLSNFKQNLLSSIDKNKLTDAEISHLISKSKKIDLCAANSNLALSLYNTALVAKSNKMESEKLSKTTSTYMDKALLIYRKYANQGSIGPIKLLCVPNHWVVEAVDQSSKEICQKALYLKNINLSANEKAKIFTAVYNAYWLPLKKHLSKRAEMCSEFANDTNIMSYSNEMLQQLNRDDCNVEFIQYGEKLFSNKNYQEAFKYLSIFDQSLNTTGIPQFELGYMYQSGEGIPQNYSLARDWYIKACAKGGSSAAQYNLGVMYMNSYGVLQNYTIAHALFNMASANGIKDAARLRDALAKKMTAVQTQKAQELASSWIKNWPDELSL